MASGPCSMRAAFNCSTEGSSRGFCSLTYPHANALSNDVCVLSLPGVSFGLESGPSRGTFDCPPLFTLLLRSRSVQGDFLPVYSSILTLSPLFHTSRSGMCGTWELTMKAKAVPCQPPPQSPFSLLTQLSNC